MKTLILSSLATAVCLSLCACEEDGDHERHHHDHRGGVTSTTTTEETVVERPVGTTTETRTIRNY